MKDLLSLNKHGYTEMPFNDPDDYEGDPRDIEIGKYLTIDPMDRPKISIYIAASIDGYIARKDGGLDWLDRVGGFDEDYGFQKLLGSIDALIIGRKTYEVATTVPDNFASPLPLWARLLFVSIYGLMTFGTITAWWIPYFGGGYF